jgi:putative transposase
VADDAGHIKANYHRRFAGEPKALTVSHEGTKWWLSVRCVAAPEEQLPPTGREVGIDLGVTNLIATSDGELMIGQQFGSRVRLRLAAAQRELATKKRGSKHYQRHREEVARLHRRVVNQRRNAAHQLSRRLVNDYDTIVVEDLRITNMLRAPKARPDPDRPGAFLPNGAAAKGALNRSISDAGWGLLVAQLSYKAASAGRTVVTVDPRHTSQRCAQCGHVATGNRVTHAAFVCLQCGHQDHADVNAARNILRAGRARLAPASVGRN